MAMRVSGINSGLDTDSIVQELVSAYSLKTEKYEKEQTKLSWKQEIWKNLNTKVNSLYKSVGNMRYSSAYSLYKTTSSDTTKASVAAGGTAVTGTQKLHILSTAQSGYLTGGKITTSDKSKLTGDSKMSELGFTGESATLTLTTKDDDGNDVSTNIEIKRGNTISEVVTKLKDAGVNASFDETNGRIFVSSQATGANGDFTLTAATKKKLPEFETDPVTGDLVPKKDDDGNIIMTEQEITDEDEKKTNETMLNLLGLNAESTDSSKKAVKLDGSDAVISLNGVVYTSTTNSFSINGLSITTNAVTDDLDEVLDSLGSDELEKLYTDENGKKTDTINWTNFDASKLSNSKAITVTTSADTQGIYDSIKDFLTNYNNIINEITELYNADSASDYEPLTDDEKDSMSDTEISKWETKIKDSLLRRDSTLSSLMNSMMNSMAQSITIDGKKYSLSSFGIQTLGYLNAAENEQNAYHINGDEDDENTSGYEDKLMAAITSDPETVVEFMKKLASNLYTAIDNQMQSTTLRSRYSIYNDKEMTTQYTNLTKTISDWEDKVSDKEDYYYSKFSSMETALAKLNSQTSSISSLLG
jgi:flagellar hook-associated protein 2